MSGKLTTPKSFAQNMLKILELINTWGVSEDPSSVNMPYLYVDTDNLKRVFIVKNNQIVSFAFPFSMHIKPDTTGTPVLSIHYRDMVLDDIIISKATSIASSLDKKKPSFASQIQSIDFTDSTQKVAVMITEVILSMEPSYLRYDYDKRGCKGVIHPLCHLDVNFNKAQTYKIGLYGEMSLDSFKNLLNQKTACDYLHSYSTLLRMKRWIADKLKWK